MHRSRFIELAAIAKVVSREREKVAKIMSSTYLSFAPQTGFGIGFIGFEDGLFAEFILAPRTEGFEVTAFAVDLVWKEKVRTNYRIP